MQATGYGVRIEVPRRSSPFSIEALGDGRECPCPQCAIQASNRAELPYEACGLAQIVNGLVIAECFRCGTNFGANVGKAHNRSWIKHPRGQAGFSLVELLVVLFVAIALAVIASPSLTLTVRKVRINSISSNLLANLRQARGEAIKLNRRVLVCAANDDGTNCAAATNWGSKGWIVCYDQDADGSCDASTATLPNPIAVGGAVDPTIATVTGPSTGISFTPTGAAGAQSAITVTGNWSGATTLTTTVSASGSIQGYRIN